MFYLHTKSYLPSTDGSLVAAIKPKAADMFLVHIIQITA